MTEESDIYIRQESPQDYEEVERLVQVAFHDAEVADGNEHLLVAKLRKSDAFDPRLALVADRSDKLVGYVLMTKITIDSEHDQTPSLALAPIAVLPSHQGIGVGARLMQRAHEVAADSGYRSIILLGHPGYYPRFGYEPAAKFGIKAPFEVPDEAFMALPLVEGGLEGVSGVVKYSAPFGL